MEKNPKKNLKNSFLSLGFLILSGITFLIGVDSFYPRHGDIVTWILIILFYGLMSLSAIMAVLVLSTGFTLIKTSKDNRNYIAIGISILVVLAIASEILKRL